MIYSDWNIKIVDVGFKLERDVFIWRNCGGETEVMSGGKMVKISGGDMLPKEPTFSLTPDQLQMLADELANKGFSPTKEYISGRLEATIDHLEDMRKLVFKEQR